MPTVNTTAQSHRSSQCACPPRLAARVWAAVSSGTAARALALSFPLATALAQPAAPSPQSPAAPSVSSSPSFVRQVFTDQARMVAAPARLKGRDFAWLAPAAGAAAYFFASDARNNRERIHTNSLAQERSRKVSNYGVISLAAAPAVLYWWGWRHADTYAERSALLTARSAVDSLIAAQAIQMVTRRETPLEGGGSGRFFKGGIRSSSFPSRHSAAAWAVASTLAERYPGWGAKVGLYGLASAVSLSRITAKEHFVSDVLVGSALGFLVGRFVGRSDHGAGRPNAWGTDAATLLADAEDARNAPPAADSIYVPLDSWVYGALDRLAALGLIPSQISGIRPWTRGECRRQTEEAGDQYDPARHSADVPQLLAALRAELAAPAGAVTLHSIYTRNGFIAGQALNDSYHFGQTWTNDSGRPFGQGWNSYTGFTASAQSGRFFAYVNGEYQRAPGRDAYSLPVRQAIAAMDGVPLRPAEAQPDVSRFRALDAYVGMRAGPFNLSVGKQSLWWGPTYDSPLSFGNNAEPTKNFKITLAHPVHIWPAREVTAEFAIGKLGGHSYTWRPWFNALKLSFKLTENLEVGFTRWSILWGEGHPITARSFARNWLSTNSPSNSWAGMTNPADPGDRKGGFDFRYRIPGLRNWLTIYTDSYCDDDPSPLANPRRAAINPGLYLSHVPGIPRLDFRVEAPSTTPLDGGQIRLGSNYWNGQYRSGNTNYGVLLGNSVGRDARALEAWTAYHASATAKVEAGFRRVKGSAVTIPGGSTETGGMLRASLSPARDWRADFQLQYQQFYVPLLGPRRSTVGASLRIAWEPDLQIQGRRK